MGVRMTRGDPRADRGFTFIAVLVLIALTSLGLAVAGPIWAHQVQREREAEMLRIGLLYADAIADYQKNAPGSLRQYPNSLEDLLLDRRFVGVKRQLRELYGDPMTPGQSWALIRDIDDRIIGVRSRSGDEPIAQRSIDLGGVMLPEAHHYSDWQFVAKGAKS